MTRGAAAPQISVLLGTSAGGAAYGAALTGVVVTAPDGVMFVTGPGVVAEMTGEQICAAELGGRLSPLRRREALTHLAVQIPTGRGLEEGLQAGYVNRVIAPEITAVAILEELERAASGRGRHGNTPL